MYASARKGIVLAAIILLIFASHLQAATLDAAKLDQEINIELMGASMSDAIAMVSSAAEIGVVGPGEPATGVIMTMQGETVSRVLDALGVATGTFWSIADEIVIFRKLPEESKPKTEPSKVPELLAPDEGMAEMISSLNPTQFYRVSAGYPLAYMELSNGQRETLKSMFSLPTVGVRDTGEVIRTLPATEQATVSFVTMPYLMVPDPDGKKTIGLRLDTTPYINLKRTLK